MKKGFTLIELAVLIGILAILAVIAIPAYVNLKEAAAKAAAEGVAGALSSAAVLNYAAESSSAGMGTTVASCSGGTEILSGDLPSGYTLSTDSIVAGSWSTCTVTGEESQTANYEMYGVA